MGKRICAVLLLAISIGLLGACRMPVSERLTHTPAVVSDYNFTLDYQVWLPEGYDENANRTYPLLVWFHGGGDNELSWGRTGKIGDIVHDRVKDGELQPFIVISPSAGSFTPLIRSYERLLLEHVLPDVREKYRVNGKTLGFGHSMGGLSALMVSMRNPQLFDAVVAASPFVFDTTPWDTPEQKKNYGEKYGSRFLKQYRYQIGMNFDSRPKADEWSPFSLARAKSESYSMKLLITVGDKDPLGLYAHNTWLHEVMLANGLEHEWYVQQDVGHGTVEDPYLMDWLNQKATGE